MRAVFTSRLGSSVAEERLDVDWDWARARWRFLKAAVVMVEGEAVVRSNEDRLKKRMRMGNRE